MDNARIEQLEKDLDSFRKDFSDIGRTLKDIASANSDKLERRARKAYGRLSGHAQDLWEEAQDFGSEYSQRARESFEDTVDGARSKVRDNPLQAVAVVAGISFIIGFLASRR